MVSLRRLLVLLGCLAPLCAQATNCTYHTGASAALTSVAMTATTGTFSPSAGDAVVVWAFTYQGAPYNTISDLAGNTWTQLPSISPYGLGGSTYYEYVFTAQNVSAYTNDTVTFTVSSENAPLVVLVADVSGAATSGSLFNGTAATFADGSFLQSHPGGSITTTTAGACLLQFYSEGGATATDTFTAGSSWTIGQQVLGSGSTYDPAFVQYQSDVAATSYTGPFTTGNFVEGGGFIIGIAPASGGTCTHEGYTSAGALATPNGSSGSYLGNAGAFVTPNCSSIEYWQPTLGNFGVSSLLAPQLWLVQRAAQLAGLPAANDDRFLLAAGGG